MRKTIILAIFFSFTLVDAASAEELKVGLIAQPSSPKEVSRVAEELITIKNNTDVDLDFGVLEATLSDQIRYLFSNTAGARLEGQKVSWAIPKLDHGQSYLVRFVVMPQAEAKDTLTTYQFLVAGKALGQLQIIQDIAPKGTTVTPQLDSSAAQVKGVTKLPATGTDPFLYLFVLLPTAFFVRAIRF